LDQNICVFLKIKEHKIITFYVVLYGCETRSLTLNELYELSVLENRILRGKIIPKKKREQEAAEI
jgi:hypothetical protein